MKLPQVSVCVPTYNGEIYIEDCLNSLITQSHWDIEILIVDDQSKDDTLSICRNFAKHDNRIRIVENDKNLGLVDNWNKCIGEAKYDWIKFAFQDDVLHPECVEKLIYNCNKNNSPIGICDRLFIIHENADESIKSYFRNDLVQMSDLLPNTEFISKEKSAEIIISNLLVNIFGEPTTYLLNRKTLKKHGLFNNKIDQLCDYEFVAKMALIYGFTYVKHPLAFFRVHGQAQSSINRGDERSNTKRIKVDYVDNVIIIDEIDKLVSKSKKYKEFDKHLKAKKDEIIHWVRENNDESAYNKVLNELHSA